MKKFLSLLFIFLFSQVVFCSVNFFTNTGNLIYIKDCSVNFFNTGVLYSDEKIKFKENYNILNIDFLNLKINDNIKYKLDNVNLFMIDSEVQQFINSNILKSIACNFSFTSSSSSNGNFDYLKIINIDVTPSIKMFNSGVTFFFNKDFNFHFDYSNISLLSKEENTSVDGKGHIFNFVARKNFYFGNNFELYILSGYIYGFGSMDAFLEKNKLLRAHFSCDASIKAFSCYLMTSISKQVSIFNINFGTGFIILPCTKYSINYAYDYNLLLNQHSNNSYEQDVLDKIGLFPIILNISANLPTEKFISVFSVQKNIFIPVVLENLQAGKSLSKKINSVSNYLDIKSVVLSGLSVELKVLF